MSFNGSGLFNIDSTGQPVASNTLIEASVFNALTADIANGLSNAICKDGQTTITANLPMAGYRHTGVGNAVARTDYAAAGQVQDGKLNWVDGGGTSDAITATYTPAITTLVDGQLCFVRATASNTTTTPTFSPNGLTARTIVKEGGSALAVGDIAGDGHELILRYDLTNTRWELLNPRSPAGLQQLSHSTIASGATVDLGTATGNTVTVTHTSGTTAITSLGGASLKRGTQMTLVFSITGGTLSLTHHATNLILAGGANITLANGDVITFVKNHDSNAEWKMTGGVRADGTPWSASAPVGSVVWHAASTPPAGYLKANGAAVSRTTYAALFAVIGTTYGSGDGSTTFNLPDLRGEFIRGWDDGRGVDPSRAIGSAQSDDFESHTHGPGSGSGFWTNGSGSLMSGSAYSIAVASTTAATGGAETRPRNIAMLACIKY